MSITFKHGGSSIMLGECFSPVAKGKVFRADEKMDETKYKTILINKQKP